MHPLLSKYYKRRGYLESKTHKYLLSAVKILTIRYQIIKTMGPKTFRRGTIIPRSSMACKVRSAMCLMFKKVYEFNPVCG